MNESNIDFIFFTGDNGIDFPKGGITSFTRQMMHVFGNRMALVGISTRLMLMGRSARQRFLSNYEISVFSNNFQRIINKCI